MAANTSQGKAWGNVMACRLADLPGWTLHVACQPCRREADLDVATLPPDRTLWQVVPRLRCRECRQLPTAIVGGTKNGGWIKLAGPGAYG